MGLRIRPPREILQRLVDIVHNLPSVEPLSSRPFFFNLRFNETEFLLDALTNIA